mgnify:CR=1 FL=1
MMNWRTLIAAAMVSLLSFVLVGCGSTTMQLPMPPGAASLHREAPGRMELDIYWDATVSMQGFTRLAAGNVYRTLPDTLGDMGSSLGDVHFFRFGEQVTPLEGREYRRFSNPECYTEMITSFGNVLDAADPGHLSVVVTDLFESEADWSNVTGKLRDKYFSEHLSVAIIGIKNSFSGDIFDVGLNAVAFSYDSGDDPGRFRPFYLFLMGPETHLRAFLEEWQRKNMWVGEMEYVVFSENFILQEQALRMSDATVKKNLFEDRQLPKKDERLQEVGIGDNKKEVEIALPFECRLDPYGCLREEQLASLDKNVKIFVWQDGGSEEGDEGNWRELAGRWDETKGNGAGISLLCNGGEGKQGSNCTLNLNFSPKDVFPSGKICAMQVQLAPGRRSLALPDWVGEWDMGSIDTGADSFDGTRTVNLLRIATSLKDSLQVAAHATVAELYLVVDGR